MEEDTGPHFQLLNEESSITGGKSVSEIVQILRTNANLKLKVRDFDDNEDAEEHLNRTSQIFPWIKKFNAQCREVIPNPDIKKLDELLTTFLKHIEDSVKGCYKKPKRAHKLKTKIFSFLYNFHWMYEQLKQPLEHASYLDKMSDVMALYIDIELKSSRRGREHPKKISERICSSLFTFLDESIEHMLDTVLKAKFFTKKYSDICCPIMMRLLKDKPGSMYDATYVRYLLSFKLWKQLAGKESYASINKAAVAKLIPPPEFAERLKTGLFSNVLPYVFKPERDRLTFFFMQSPFNVKKKAQVFLKEEKKMQPNLDVERGLLFDDDVQITSFFEEDNFELNNEPDVLLNDIWTSLVDKEDDIFDNLFIPMESMESKDDDCIIVDFKSPKPKEKVKKITKDKATNGVLKTAIKKRKAIKVTNSIVKNISSKDTVIDLIRSDLTKPLSSVISKEEIDVVSCTKSEDPLSSIVISPEVKQPKPCATVEPEQCKEVTDSLSNMSQVLPIKLHQNPSTSNSVAPEVTESTIEEKPSPIEISTTIVVTNQELGVDNPTISIEDAPEAVLMTIVDSSGIHEEVKSETHSKALFEVSSDSTFKIGKTDDAGIFEEGNVAEEVVISSEMEQDPIYLYLENQPDIMSVNQTDIMNVIGITRDSTAFVCDDGAISEFQEELSTKDQEKQQIAISTMLDNQNISSNNSQETKQTKENVSPENQFLSSFIASTGTTENYVSLLRRQDSYTCNEMMLQRLFSDPTSVDDGSDEDNRYQKRQRFAGGGKLPAFRERMEEAKSDNDEDFEALTPSSDSQQQSPMDTSIDVTSLQPTTTESSPPESDQELKSLQNPVGDESCPRPDSRGQYQQGPCVMKELSVQVSLGDLLNANEHIPNKEKTSPKGMFPPDSFLHFKTVDFDTKFNRYQQQLDFLYNTVENILETDPVPFPPEKVIGYPINGYVRCPCCYCAESFFKLYTYSKILYDRRCCKIMYHVDKKRMITKMFDKQLEDEKLLKSIEDTISVNYSKDLNSGNKLGSIECCDERNRDPDDNAFPSKGSRLSIDNDGKKTNSDETAFPRKESPCLEPKSIEAEAESESVESIDKSESKNGYASLPPKKRKAFSAGPEPNRVLRSNTKDQPVVSAGNNVLTSQNQRGKSCNKNPITDNKESDKSNTNTDPISSRYSPVKIKSVDGSYCVLSGNSCSTGESVVDSNENISKNVKKKCKKHHRTKEEKKLKKEQKRLKKLKKQEEMLNK